MSDDESGGALPFSNETFFDTHLNVVQAPQSVIAKVIELLDQQASTRLMQLDDNVNNNNNKDNNQAHVFCDLGSGEGRIVIAAAKYWMNRSATSTSSSSSSSSSSSLPCIQVDRFVGVDNSENLIELSKATATAAVGADVCEFRLGDVFSIDLSEFTLLCAHLPKHVLEKLKPTLAKRLRQRRCLLATVTFAPSGWKPFLTNPMYEIYLYDWTFE
jgi:hypothetical protein